MSLRNTIRTWLAVLGLTGGHDRRETGSASEHDDEPDRADAADPIENDSIGTDPVVDLPVGDEIDLHAFNPRDIRDLVDTYLHEAQRLGYREVRVVHGKGKGVQRRIVRSLLDDHPVVRTYRQADHTRGSWGATIVFLHPSPLDDPPGNDDAHADAEGSV